MTLMAAFPRLKTGAVCQYPLGRNSKFQTEVISFGDGSEQRYRDFKGALREWVIGLDLLTDAEITSLESFYWANGGAAGTFEFTDPFDAVVYPTCEFDESVRFAFDGPGRGSTQIVLRERR
jgi:phage-related protein